jgi:hypothetical protein
MAGMDENPYRAPAANATPKSPIHPFLRLPTTVIEWVSIVLVILAIGALCLPNFEEGREAARKRLGTQINGD